MYGWHKARNYPSGGMVSHIPPRPCPFPDSPTRNVNLRSRGTLPPPDQFRACPVVYYTGWHGGTPGMAKGGKILVVEDEAHERQGLADLLRAWGYEAEIASDGAEALEKVAAFDPTLILSDL